MTDVDTHSIPTLTHGRMLVRHARAGASRGVIVGFHGYMENAATQLDRLAGVSQSSRWTLVSVQGLHRFYRGRSEEVVASWMTREDRDDASADNLAYVGAALEAVPHDRSMPIIYAGFSQGVAMAFRAAVHGRNPGAGVIAVGGDVPPELMQDASVRFPRVLLARGRGDQWYTQAQFDADMAGLRTRGVPVQPCTYDGAHVWNDATAVAVADFLSQPFVVDRSEHSGSR